MGEQMPNEIALAGKKVAYAYGRGSTIKQVMTLDVQRERCEAYYRERLADEFRYGGWFGEPAKSAVKTDFLDRPVAHEMVNRMGRGDQLVITKLDRGFRSVKDFCITWEVFRDRGITLHFTDIGADPRTPAGMLHLQILASFAQYEAALIAERTREVKAWCKRQGRATNGYAGYGFTWKGERGRRRRVKNEHERRVMAWIVKNRLDGYSWKELYHHLVENAVLTAKGKPWSVMRIRRAFLAELELQASEARKSLGQSDLCGR